MQIVLSTEYNETWKNITGLDPGMSIEVRVVGVSTDGFLGHESDPLLVNISATSKSISVH